MPRYAELATTTNFSFLRGASHPEEMVTQAIALGHCGIGIADSNSLAGVVRAFSFLREHKEAAPGFRLAVGARLIFADETPDILCYPEDRAAYGRLCRLLTRGNMRAEKGRCVLSLDDLVEHGEGLQLIVMDGALPPRLLEAFEGRLWLAAAALDGAMRRIAASGSLRGEAVFAIMPFAIRLAPSVDIGASMTGSGAISATGSISDWISGSSRTSVRCAAATGSGATSASIETVASSAGSFSSTSADSGDDISATAATSNSSSSTAALGVSSGATSRATAWIAAIGSASIVVATGIRSPICCAA